MTTEFTPGPWHVFEPLEQGSQHSIGHWIPGKDERYWLASIYPVREVPHKFGAPHCDEAEANARLIAAAPDLYAACKAARAILTDGHETVWQALNAAIAKAEGAE